METPAIRLMLGDYREVMRDVVADLLCSDTPYSERTEAGVRSGSTMQDQRNALGMGYEPVTQEWAHEFVAFWHPRTRGWMVIYGDHISIRWYEEALAEVRYTFAPIPLIKRGAAPRMCADGPASQSESIIMARPKRAAFVGTWPGLRGWYEMDTVRALNGSCGVRGAKSLAHMREIVADYSRPGDLVADATCGSGTTLIAASLEGRRAIGAELDPDTYAKARLRIERGNAGLRSGWRCGRPESQHVGPDQHCPAGPAGVACVFRRHPPNEGRASASFNNRTAHALAELVRLALSGGDSRAFARLHAAELGVLARTASGLLARIADQRAAVERGAAQAGGEAVTGVRERAGEEVAAAEE